MISAGLIIVWIILIVFFAYQAIGSWQYYLLFRKEEWARKLPAISHFEAKGQKTPNWWCAPNKPPITWFRNKLIGLTFAAIPFNLLTLYWYIAGVYGLARPVWQPEYFTTWLIMTLLVGWVSGFSLYGQCTYMELYFLSRKKR